MAYDPNRFEQSPMGRLVPTVAGGVRTRAFVPNPLPHDLDFDASLVTKLGEARGAVGELGGLAFTLANPALMAAPLLRREAVLSSRIEGTRTTIEDLYRIEAKQLNLPGLVGSDEHAEVLNYVKALQTGYENLDSLSLSLRNIQDMHRVLMTGVRGGHRRPGEFRSTQNWIAGGAEDGVAGAIFVPPPLPEMREALADLEAFLHSEQVDPLIAIALGHYQFEAIHPFADGNGRVGRLLISLAVVHRELLPTPILYISGYLEEHRSRYYDLLLAVSRDGALNEWVEFILDAVVSESRRSIALLRYFNSLRDDWRQRVTQKRTSALVLQTVEQLFELPTVTIPVLAAALGVKYPSAQRIVTKLVDAEILVPAQKVSGTQLFVAPEIVRTLTQGLPLGATSGNSSRDQ